MHKNPKAKDSYLLFYMKILQLCRKFPYPLKDGESIAVTSLAKGYQELGIALTLLSFNTIKHFCEIDKLPPTFNHYEAIHTVYLDNFPEPKGAFLNLFSKKSYHISRFTTKAFTSELTKILTTNSFDIIQLESVYFAPYLPIIRKLSKAKVVMRAHNVEFEIWDRVAKNTTFLPKKWYLTYLVKKLRRFEVAQLANYDLLLAMTAKDLTYFQKLGYQNDSLITPIGLQLNNYQKDEIVPQKPALSFIGSLDWVPNQEGLTWFLAEVWRDLRKQFPNLEIHIAGRNTPDWIFNKAGNGIIVHGEVPNASEFLVKYPISIVPLFSGSGMRVKILESMALARAVVTTQLGLEGIPAQHKKELLIADSKEAFLETIGWVLQNEPEMLAIRKAARYFIEHNYDNKSIAKTVLEKFSVL